MNNSKTNGKLRDHDFAFIRGFVRKRSAIALEADKHYLVESRLLPVVRREGLSSIEELVHLLQTRPFSDLHRTVVEAMTTNETSFFRDRHPFDMLKTHIIPELLDRRGAERRLRIWCAACSSGQEPYSIAMLLQEHFPSLASWTIDILGTDISTQMIRRSQEGRYSQLEVNRGLPAQFLVRYFEKTGSEWRIRPEVRDVVRYEEINLADTWPMLGRWDIVFIRNVMIYFDIETKRSILGKIRDQLRSDGYLFLGGAETTLNLDERFERMEFPRAGCYRLRPQADGVYAMR